MESIYNLAHITDAAKEFIISINAHKVIVFIGDMGAGKTTFIKEVCKQLGVTENISSPTFSIINQYRTKENKIIFHIDLYRIKDIEEAINAGVEECIYSGNLCFIEWPEKATSLFPKQIVEVYLHSTVATERKIIIKVPEIKI